MVDNSNLEFDHSEFKRIVSDRLKLPEFASFAASRSVQTARREEQQALNTLVFEIEHLEEL